MSEFEILQSSSSSELSLPENSSMMNSEVLSIKEVLDLSDLKLIEKIVLNKISKANLDSEIRTELEFYLNAYIEFRNEQMQSPNVSAEHNLAVSQLSELIISKGRDVLNTEKILNQQSELSYELLLSSAPDNISKRNISIDSALSDKLSNNTLVQMLLDWLEEKIPKSSIKLFTSWVKNIFDRVDLYDQQYFEPRFANKISLMDNDFFSRNYLNQAKTFKNIRSQDPNISQVMFVSEIFVALDARGNYMSLLEFIRKESPELVSVLFKSFTYKVNNDIKKRLPEDGETIIEFKVRHTGWKTYPCPTGYLVKDVALYDSDGSILLDQKIESRFSEFGSVAFNIPKKGCEIVYLIYPIDQYLNELKSLENCVHNEQEIKAQFSAYLKESIISTGIVEQLNKLLPSFNPLLDVQGTALFRSFDTFNVNDQGKFNSVYDYLENLNFKYTKNIYVHKFFRNAGDNLFQAILGSRLCTCDPIAYVFDCLMRKAGLPVFHLVGIYTKGEDRDLGLDFSTGHAQNACILNGKISTVDLTKDIVSNCAPSTAEIKKIDLALSGLVRIRNLNDTDTLELGRAIACLYRRAMPAEDLQNWLFSSKAISDLYLDSSNDYFYEEQVFLALSPDNLSLEPIHIKFARSLEYFHHVNRSLQNLQLSSLLNFSEHYHKSLEVNPMWRKDELNCPEIVSFGKQAELKSTYANLPFLVCKVISKLTIQDLQLSDFANLLLDRIQIVVQSDLNDIDHFYGNFYCSANLVDFIDAKILQFYSISQKLNLITALVGHALLFVECCSNNPIKSSVQHKVYGSLFRLLHTCATDLHSSAMSNFSESHAKNLYLIINMLSVLSDETLHLLRIPEFADDNIIEKSLNALEDLEKYLNVDLRCWAIDQINLLVTNDKIPEIFFRQGILLRGKFNEDQSESLQGSFALNKIFMNRWRLACYNKFDSTISSMANSHGFSYDQEALVELEAFLIQIFKSLKSRELINYPCLENPASYFISHASDDVVDGIFTKLSILFKLIKPMIDLGLINKERIEKLWPQCSEKTLLRYFYSNFEIYYSNGEGLCLLNSRLKYQKSVVKYYVADSEFLAQLIFTALDYPSDVVRKFELEKNVYQHFISSSSKACITPELILCLFGASLRLKEDINKFLSVQCRNISELQIYSTFIYHRIQKQSAQTRYLALLNYAAKKLAELKRYSAKKTPFPDVDFDLFELLKPIEAATDKKEAFKLPMNLVINLISPDNFREVHPVNVWKIHFTHVPCFADWSWDYYSPFYDLYNRALNRSIKSKLLLQNLLINSELSYPQNENTDFDRYQDYQQGDDPKYIAWNIFHRTGQLLIKKYEQTRINNLVIVVDLELIFGDLPMKNGLSVKALADLIAMIRQAEALGMSLSIDLYARDHFAQISLNENYLQSFKEQMNKFAPSFTRIERILLAEAEIFPAGFPAQDLLANVIDNFNHESCYLLLFKPSNIKSSEGTIKKLQEKGHAITVFK